MMFSPVSQASVVPVEWPLPAARFRALPLYPRDQVGHFMQYGA
jgi:hypothetical protein